MPRYEQEAGRSRGPVPGLGGRGRNSYRGDPDLLLRAGQPDSHAYTRTTPASSEEGGGIRTQRATRLPHTLPQARQDPFKCLCSYAHVQIGLHTACINPDAHRTCTAASTFI